MNSSSHFSPPRARVLLASAACPSWTRRKRVLAAGFLLVWPAFYGAVAQSAPTSSSATEPLPMRLRVGKSITFPLAQGATYSAERGGSLALIEAQSGALSVRALSPGLMTIRLQNPGSRAEVMAFRFVNAAPIPAPLTAPIATAPVATTPVATAPVATTPVAAPAPASNRPDPLSQIPPIPTAIRPLPSPTIRTSSGFNPAPAASNSALNVRSLGASPNALPAPAPATPGLGSSQVPDTSGLSALPLATPTPTQVLGAPVRPASGSQNTSRSLSPVPPRQVSQAIRSVPAPLRSVPSSARSLPTPLRSLPSSARSLPTPVRSTPTPVRSIPRPVRSTPTPVRSGGGLTRISPVVPAPISNRRADVVYRTTPSLPRSLAPAGPRPSIVVTQGLARLVSFPDNILSVFFSDPNVMDARAINARTIAVTGSGAGTSTLAVFTSRFPGDAVGHANIYRVQTTPRGGSSAAPALSGDPRALETAITAALGDPRVRASVVRVPDGSLVATLQGVVRNAAEVSGAVSTAQFYVPRVVPSLYADVNAPSIDAVRSGALSLSPNDTLQESLRRLTGNSSIELIALPTGLALKAATNSTEEAEAILRVLPSLNQPIVPFIVVHGLANSQSPYYNSDVPLLQGEDRQLTDKLQSVTGVRTVYAVRASGNSIAIYGNVLTRGQYEAVKRYGLIIAQQSLPIAPQGAGQGGAILRPFGAEQPVLPAYDPAGGYARALGVQMFVRILDPAQATIRNVTVETNVVEISRTALQNLGVQFGSAPVLTETRTPGTAGTITVLRDAAGNPVIGANGSPVTQTTGATGGNVIRTINPSLNQGVITAANGFIGGRPFQFLDPLRAQLTALSNKGDARILARPNVSAMEGMAAQITIGGERPVPSAVATTGATAQSVEFRRFGVIISMRPTVSDDNTIILQIRADITQPDRTFEINLGGSLIPGESVRSVDTTLAVRPGDVIVMGGLMTNEKRQQTSRVPILSSIPIIGSLFTSKRFENNETELAIFMTPRIDFLPATETTREILGRGPALPPLPSRQESNGILFQNTTRTPG